jgi:DNA-binding CsgD family transcriptional regulator
MDHAIKLAAFASEDQQAALAIMDLLSRCQTRNEFNRVLKTTLIPLIDCSGAFYGHLEGNQNTLRLLGSINQSSLCQPTWSNFLELVIQGQILEHPVTDDTYAQLATKAFCCIGLICQYCLTGKSCHHVNRCCTLVAMMDAPGSAAVLYFCYLKPQDQFHRLRNFKLLQFLRPFLLRTIKTILAQEENQNFQLILDHLSDHNEPLAIVRNGGVLVYKNHSFDKIVGCGDFLLTILPQLNTVKSLKKMSHCFLTRLGRRLYEITLKLVNKECNDNEHLYLLRLSRVTNKNNQMSRKLLDAGLTGRELEIAGLIYQGITARDISEQIHLSYHTVRNHIKNIYRKMGVSTRSEMLVWVG